LSFPDIIKLRGDGMVSRGDFGVPSRAWVGLRVIVGICLCAGLGCSNSTAPSAENSQTGATTGSNQQSNTAIAWRIVSGAGSNGPVLCSSADSTPCSLRPGSQLSAIMDFSGTRAGRHLSGEQNAAFFGANALSTLRDTIIEEGSTFTWGLSASPTTIPGAYHWTARVEETGAGLSSPNVLSFDVIITVVT
jgi:hypothetical protein